jgi:hypothetical protein
MTFAVRISTIGFPPITVPQPSLYDLVDDPVRIRGVGTGFEGQIGPYS